jgi:hypothetical protein
MSSNSHEGGWKGEVDEGPEDWCLTVEALGLCMYRM